MKKSNPYFGTILAIGVVLIFQLEYIRNLIDPFKEYFPIFWIVLIIWSIYKRLEYKKGKTVNQIRIPTNNDDFNKTTPFIFGLILTIGSFFALRNLETEIVLWSLLLLTGILLLVLGFLFIPSGKIEIKKNILSFQNGSRLKSIEVEKINNIELRNHELLVQDKDKKMHIINHMNLNESDYHNIINFLETNLDRKIEIEAYFETVVQK